MEAHETGRGHPEALARLRALEAALAADGPRGVSRAAPREATHEELGRAHTAGYLARMASLEGRFAALDPDTVVSPGSGLAARLAAGAACQAVDALREGRADRIFAWVRPPGHHALADSSMGFCVYANAAIAAEHALQSGFERVWIADWDVHHGNGTQAAFWDRPDVLFCSTHQAPPFWPGTGASEEVGAGRGRGFTANVPLPAGATDADHLAAFEQVFQPIADRFAPDLVIVSAGFDAHRDDPLGGQRMTAEGFAGLCGAVARIAERHAGGRMILLLEGGYDLEALGESAVACTHVLAGATPPQSRGPRPAAEAAIRATRAALAACWSDL
jgi:acetoin utilization deacetylase AcuC-like enzyme